MVSVRVRFQVDGGATPTFRFRVTVRYELKRA